MCDGSRRQSIVPNENGRLCGSSATGFNPTMSAPGPLPRIIGPGVVHWPHNFCVFIQQ